MTWKLYRIISTLILLPLLATTASFRSIEVDASQSQEAYLERSLVGGRAENLSVIVTGTDFPTALQSVKRLGGEITSELWLINAVAAKLPADKLVSLANTHGIVSVVENKKINAAQVDQGSDVYVWDGWVTDRRVRLFEADYPLVGKMDFTPVPLPDGGVFAATKAGDAAILNPDGSLRATFTLSGKPYSDRPVTDKDGVIYINGYETVHAINPDGTIKWETAAPVSQKFLGGLAFSPAGDTFDLNILYAADEKGIIYGLDPESGDFLFQVEQSGNIESFIATPVGASDGVMYIVNEKGTLSAFRAYEDQSGSLAVEEDWSVTLTATPPYKLSPQIGTDGSIYVASASGTVFALNPDGSFKYPPFSRYGEISSQPAIASDGSIFVSYGTDDIYGIAPDGNEKMYYENESEYFNTSPVLSNDERILFVAAKKGVLVALDTDSGQELWQYETSGDILSSPVLAGNGNLHLGDKNGNYIVISPDGMVMFKFPGMEDGNPDGFKEFLNSPSITNQGTVYFHDDEKRIVALVLMDDEWDGVTPDVEPTNSLNKYRVQYPFTIDVGADIVYDNGVDGSNVTVAVVDSGVQIDEDTLAVLGPIVETNFLGQYDFLSDDDTCQSYGGTYITEDGYCLTDHTNSHDGYGHGSHVTGTIWNNLLDYHTNVHLGVAPDAKILSVRVLGDDGSSSYEEVIKGIQFVVANKDSFTPGIRVINLSLSATATTPYFVDPLNRAVEKAWAAGIVVLAAAGNVGAQAETITVPGNDPYVITVSSVNGHRTAGYWADDSLVSWTSSGPTLDGFLKPDILAPGMNIVSYMHNPGDLEEAAYLVRNHPDYSLNTSLFRMNGTSMATAVASGIVALMLDHNPSLTPDEVKFRLNYSAQQLADRYGAISENVFRQGAGRVWAPEAVFGDIPSGNGNAGMDINADLNHGWDTPEELYHHYEGFVQKTLSEDGSVYLYYVINDDGTGLALGMADALTGEWLSGAEIQQRSSFGAQGVAVWDGGEIYWSGGLIIWDGGDLFDASGNVIWDDGSLVYVDGALFDPSGNLVWSDGDLFDAAGKMVWSGGNMVWSGGNMVWSGGDMVWSGGQLFDENGVQIGDGTGLIWSGSQLFDMNGNLVWEAGDLFDAAGKMVWSGGNMVWSGGKMVWSGGKMVWSGGKMVWSGGNMVWSGGKMVWSGGKMVWSGGKMVWSGGKMVWSGGNMVWSGSSSYWDQLPTSEPTHMRLLDKNTPTETSSLGWEEGKLFWAGGNVRWLGGNMYWNGSNENWQQGLEPGSKGLGVPAWVNDDGSVEGPNGDSGPSAATISTFGAKFEPVVVVVDWSTSIETGLAGFNLYRSRTIGGERVQLNQSLIPAEAIDPLLGTDYMFDDHSIQPGDVYYYWLEMVDLSSGTTTLDPIETTVPHLVYLPLAVNSP
jgi:hypothetical protein